MGLPDDIYRWCSECEFRNQKTDQKEDSQCQEAEQEKKFPT